VGAFALTLLAAAAVIAADQCVKLVALARPGAGAVMAPRVFAGVAARPLAALWLACAGAVAVEVAAGAIPPLAGIGAAAAAAGAASNLIDLRRRGAVVDLFSLGRWPTFNLADVAITAGTVTALAAVVAA
jgi:lipoprotein signal peptidase